MAKTPLSAYIDELEAEVKRLTLADKQWADHVKRLADERDEIIRDDNAIISALRTEIERLRTRLAAAERVVEAARYDHMDPEDGVEQGVYDNLCGLCQALQAFDAACLTNPV